jgi:hypothetical protein
MTRDKGTGRLSYRGLLAVGIGAIFIWFSLSPQSFADDVPPLAVRVIMFLAGAALVYGGAASLLFVWKRGGMVRSHEPVAAEIYVLEDDDSDRTTETVHVRVDGRCQSIGVDRSGAVQNYLDGKVRWGEAWLNEKGMVFAVAISGEHFNTLIGGTEIPAASFGKPQKTRC